MCWSATMALPWPLSAVTAPRLARKPEENTRAAGAPQNLASSYSSSVCTSVEPLAGRAPVAPAPQRSAAAAAAPTTRLSRARPR